jgi:hypothetical protein
MVAPCSDCAQATHTPRSPVLERAYPRTAWPRPLVSGLAAPTPWRRLAMRPCLWMSSPVPGCTAAGVRPRPRPLAARGRAVAWRARAGERTWSFHRPRPRMAWARHARVVAVAHAQERDDDASGRPNPLLSICFHCGRRKEVQPIFESTRLIFHG